MNKKMKTKPKHRVRFIYKFLLVLSFFFASLVFFSSGIKESIFDNEKQTVTMKEASFPLISMEVEGVEMNLMHGYAANLDSRVIRDCIIPVTGERSFTVNIDERGSNVKKLKYQIFNIDGRQKEEDSFTILEDGEGKKNQKISLKETYETGAEYILKLTLITNTSKRIYYYSRIKMYDQGRLQDKIDFILNFHKTLLDPNGRRAEALMDWLEPSRATDISTFAHVGIKSRLNMVSYGSLNPKVVYEQVPTVTEFYENYASVRIDYILSVDTETGTEYYRAEEDYRIGLKGDRIYLYNYDRSMEELFDIKQFSLENNEFKLGICEPDAASAAISPNGKYVAFVYGGELIVYDTEEFSAAMAFSLSNGEADYTTELHKNHDIKILRVRDDGGVDFYVSGYMSSGEYEGRVGVALYDYSFTENVREEKMFMPINSAGQILKADLSEFTFLGDRQVFYFSIYGNIYAYNLASAKLETVAADIDGGEPLYFEDEKYIAWVDRAGEGSEGTIHILHLDTGEQHEIKSPYGAIRLLGKINNNIIYGLGNPADSIRGKDGSLFQPYYRMVIADGSAKVLKSYEEEDLFISGIEIGENIITIRRVRYDGEKNEYKEADSDTILNNPEVKRSPVPIVKRTSERMLTEYYIGLPGDKKPAAVPEIKTAAIRVLNRDTTARLPDPKVENSCYYAYSFGKVVAADEDATDVIQVADKGVGTVINREGKLIWERGIKTARTDLTTVKGVKAAGDITSAEAAMQTIAGFRELEFDTLGFDPEKGSIFEYLNKNMKPSIVDMTGSTLDQVLYSVYRKHPVIAIRGNGSACVIVAYDQTSITLYDPVKGDRVKVGMIEAVKDFKKNGNIFISYVG